MKRILAPAAAPAFAIALAGCSHGALPAFRATLARHQSATEALGEWCAARHIADPATIRAVPVIGDEVVPAQDVRAELGVGPDEPLGYRHVRLMCGDTVLSDARNWYVPARLTREMNETLASSSIPFGKVVAPLDFTRETLAETVGGAAGCPADTALAHRARLRRADGAPISVLVECYPEKILRWRGTT